MKIGLVIESLDPRRGGVEQWTWQFCRWLVRNGHEVHLVARHFSTEVEELSVHKHLVRSSPRRVDFATAAEKILRGLTLDVIHDTGCGWYCDLLQPHGGSRVAAFRQNQLLLPAWVRPLKWFSSWWLPRYRDFERLTRRQYASPNRLFLAISRMVATDMQRFHQVRPEQLRIVYNGVDVERFTPVNREVHREEVRARLGIEAEEIVVLIVAHNFRLKGVPALLRSVGTLRAKGHRVRLVVAGGKGTHRWQRMAQKAKAWEETIFLGSVDDPVPYYAAADIYAQPTLYDPCSLVVLEALAAGLPVVTSRFNGAGELITPGEQGFILEDPQDPMQISNALEEMMDETRRLHMSLAARQLALAHTFERNCREILALYQQVSEGKRRAA